MIAVLIYVLIYSCGSSNKQEGGDSTKNKSTEDLASFIVEPEYGWKQADKDYFLAFMSDGRVAIEDDEGEATMWEGTWSLEGKTLTIKSEEFGEQVYTIEKKGQDLYLNDDKFLKYTI